MKQRIKLKESELKRMISESVRKVLNENAYDYYADAEDRYMMRERLPKGWEKHETEDGIIYTDPDYNEYVKDEYGNFEPLN